MANYDDLAQALASKGAAFGVFPQMGGRRRFQDPQASADVPFQALRGSFAGLLGMLPDVANFMGRSPMPTEALGEFDYGPRQQLPYGTEFYLKELPLAPTSPVGQLAGQIGSFVPLSPMPAVRAGKGIARMAGQEITDVMSGFPPRSLLGQLTPKPLMAVEPQMQMAQAITKPKAEVSPLGFYSAVEQQALNIPRKQGTGASFLNELAKGQDVKKYEMETIGLDEFLKNKPNVTRQEVQDYIANNRINVQERQLGGALSPEMQTTRDALSDKYKGLVDNIADAKSQFEEGKISYAQVRDTVSNNQVQIQALDTQINEINKTILPTQYGKYQLPGGENYRELLLTLPKQSPTTNDIANKLFGKEMRFLSEAEIDAVVSEARRIESTTPKDFASSHFSEPNILAHMRVNDRIDADGKKMLLIEEVQSDWHQAGREKGYNTPEKRAAEQKKLDDLLIERQQLGERQKQLEELASPYTSQGKDAPTNILDEWNSVSNRLNRLQTEQNRLGRTFGDTGVPDAPFKDTWHQLALKRALKEAVDKGYDRIGLTTGAQQAERYKLTNEVDEINVIGRIDARTGEKSRQVALDLKSGGSYKLGVNNEGIIDNVNMLEINNLQGKKLADVVGKEVAKKIMESNSQTIKGEGLNIGGEGMKKYYDEVYPNYLDKLGKKYGARVGETKVNTVKERAENSMIPTMKQEPVRYLDITPEMRKAIKEGQPLASIEEELAKALA